MDLLKNRDNWIRWQILKIETLLGEGKKQQKLILKKKKHEGGHSLVAYNCTNILSNYAVFVLGLILFALEYKKTPTSAIAVPATKIRTTENKMNNNLCNFSKTTKFVHHLKTIERDLPSALIGVTGVWKKITEETMTTTRFTQFPTECVTGDTFSNIPYETCHQMLALFTFNTNYWCHNT